MTESQQADQSGQIDPPPLLRCWKNVYFAVLLYLSILIATLWWLTREFSY